VRVSPPGLLIGWLGRCPDGEIFLVAMVIQHMLIRLTLSGHVAIAGACPRACRSNLATTPVARRGGDNGIGIDELTVMEVREEGEKGGVP
jgi:hypothetical protein